MAGGEIFTSYEQISEQTTRLVVLTFNSRTNAALDEVSGSINVHILQINVKCGKTCRDDALNNKYERFFFYLSTKGLIFKSQPS